MCQGSFGEKTVQVIPHELWVNEGRFAKSSVIGVMSLKKRLPVALSTAVLVLTLGLFGCGGSGSSSSGSAASGKSGSWTVANTTDEFGDVTEDSTSYFRSEISGTFSNVVITDGDFSGTVDIAAVPVSGTDYVGYEYHVDFSMLEKAEKESAPFVYVSEGDNTCELKTKNASGQKNSYYVEGAPPNGPLTVIDYQKTLIEDLRGGDKLQCVLKYEGTTFEFSIDGKGFSEVFDPYDKAVSDQAASAQAEIDAAKQKAAEEEEEARKEAEAALDALQSHSDSEAVEKIKSFTQEDKKFAYAVVYLDEHIDEYSALSQSDLESLFPGNYYLINIRNAKDGLGFIDGYVYEYGDDGVARAVENVNSDGSRTERSSDTPRKYSVEGGKLVLMSDETAVRSWTKNYEVRKVAKDFYVVLDEGKFKQVMWPAD